MEPTNVQVTIATMEGEVLERFQVQDEKETEIYLAMRIANQVEDKFSCSPLE